MNASEDDYYYSSDQESIDGLGNEDSESLWAPSKSPSCKVYTYNCIYKNFEYEMWMLVDHVLCFELSRNSYRANWILCIFNLIVFLLVSSIMCVLFIYLFIIFWSSLWLFTIKLEIGLLMTLISNYLRRFCSFERL